MADLRIADAPELTTSAVEDGLKVPTGGFGNYSITMFTISDWLLNYKNFATKTYVDNSVGTANQGLSNHVNNKNNPHEVTKAQVGLGNVNNTADLDKPISNATSAALSLKTDKTYVDNSVALKVDQTTYDVFYNHEKSGQVYTYDSAYATSIGGYPLHARIALSNGDIVRSIIANNNNNPNNDMTGWKNVSIVTASDVIYGSTNQNEINKKTITIVATIAELLAITTPENGQQVYVKSYKTPTNLAQLQPYKGGGLFVYDSSKISTNDGVFCFNGWVKQFNSSIISSYDLGVDQSTSDCTSVLQNFFNIVKGINKSIIFRIEDYLKLSATIIVDGVSNMRIEGGGTLSAFEHQDTFYFVPSTLFEQRRVALGILSLHDCHNFVIDNIDIIGAKQTWTGIRQYEWGDCAVRYEQCSNIQISNCRMQKFGGWGIFGMWNTNSLVFGNYIYDVVRQSGINVFSRSTFSQVYDNYIEQVGLYAIEMESSLEDSRGHVVHSNYMTNCRMGIASVSGITQSIIHSNYINNCRVGVYAVRTNFANVKEVEFSNNTVVDCYRGALINNSKNINFCRNSLMMNTVPTYYLLQPYHSVLGFGSDGKSFYCLVGDMNGWTITFDWGATTYVVQSVVLDPTKTQYQAAGLYLVTVDRTLVDVEFNDLFEVNVIGPSNGQPWGIGLQMEELDNAVVDGNDNVIVANNLLSGRWVRALATNAQYTSTTAIKQKFINNDVSLYESGTRYGFYFGQYYSPATQISGLNRTNAGLLSSTSNTTWSSSSIKSERTLKFSGSVSSGSNGKKHYMRFDTIRQLIGVNVYMQNYTSTDPIYIAINTADAQTLQILAASPTTTVLGTAALRNAYATTFAKDTNYFIQVTTANKVLVASDYEIELLFL